MGDYVYNADQLASLPDNSLIMWEAVPGDPTSETVAFLRREHHPPLSNPVPIPPPTLWVTPGALGEPLAPTDAGVTYPARVMRYGGLDGTLDGVLPAPVLTTTDTFDIAATALECAVSYHAGDVRSPESVIAVASEFADWLRAQVDDRHTYEDER